MAPSGLWTPVTECAKMLDVPATDVQRLVDLGLVNYSFGEDFRTTVRPDEVERVMARQAASLMRIEAKLRSLLLGDDE